MKTTARPLIGDKWVEAELIDAAPHNSASGEGCVLQFEITSPRKYAGKVLYQYLVPSMKEFTIASLEERFPGIHWLDSESVWEALNNTTVRIHIGIAEAQNGYPAKDRIVSIWPSGKAEETSED